MERLLILKKIIILIKGIHNYIKFWCSDYYNLNFCPDLETNLGSAFCFTLNHEF